MIRYISKLIQNAPTVLTKRTLAPADNAMNGDIIFGVNGNDIQIPLSAISRLLKNNDETPTFGSLREMYAQNVYLRAFRSSTRISTVVDLGANRGLFSILTILAYGADIAVGIEPMEYYTPVLNTLCRANNIDPCRLPREEALVGSKNGQGCVTILDIMGKYRLREIDFLKCDIEGAEFDVFLNENSFLQSVRNISMELHAERGDCQGIISLLKDIGFKVRVTDQFGAVVNGTRPNYLYASTVGDLLS